VLILVAILATIWAIVYLFAYMIIGLLWLLLALGIFVTAAPEVTASKWLFHTFATLIVVGIGFSAIYWPFGIIVGFVLLYGMGNARGSLDQLVGDDEDEEDDGDSREYVSLRR